MSIAVSGVVLAGGLGRRMGGADKGLVMLDGQPLVAHVLARLVPQVDEILISANRNLERYRAFGHRVLEDRITGFAGPLAGLHAGLSAASHELVLSVPCDVPALPADLAARLARGMEAEGAEAAVARAGGRLHPVFCLCRRELRHGLETFLAGGGRRFRDWLESVDCTVVDFDDPECFGNINTPKDLPPHPSADP
jgi:molybdopterin-guanine dinucleotide biosynthesis protein A